MARFPSCKPWNHSSHIQSVRDGRKHLAEDRATTVAAVTLERFQSHLILGGRLNSGSVTRPAPISNAPIKRFTNVVEMGVLLSLDQVQFNVLGETSEPAFWFAVRSPPIFRRAAVSVLSGTWSWIQTTARGRF
jgi:hypothetical protein